MSKQTAVRLPDELNQRLVNLSNQTGRTVAYYMREAISTHIDDLEDIYIAEQALERLRKGKDQVISSEEFWDGIPD
jgi:RHH-type rel operon transcriptional repressor/antitoxin RelB